MTNTRRYIRIEPAHERLDPSTLVSRLAGLRKIKTGWTVKYDPRKSAPTFEFLALTRGNDAPVKFYFGVDDEGLLSTVQSELETAYPASYNISTEELALEAELCGQPTDETAGDESHSLSERTPVAARWSGVGERSKDWMTTLRQYSQLQDEQSDPTTATTAPLATAIDQLSQATVPTVIQVLFSRYGSWQKLASQRKNQIQTRHDGLIQSAKTDLHDMVMGVDEERIRDRRRGRDVPHAGESTRQTASVATGEVASRQALIDRKGPAQTFLANVRAAAVPPADADDAVTETVAPEMDALTNAFNHLDGYFYHLNGDRLTKSLTDLRHPAQKELSRLLNRDLNISKLGKKRPQLILNADELANFVAVPSAEGLTTEGARGAREKEQLRQPLPMPTPDMLEAFAEPGMAIGKPLEDRQQPVDDSIRIPPKLLTTHYLRAASTGSGKSKAVQNDMLSLNEHVGGPTVLLDSKGDGMAENYLKAHYQQNGDTEDVYYFDTPETLPAISFFDIRPALAAGRSRKDAVQDTVEHFHEVMRLILGQETYDRAFVANEVLTFLIKALFDREYGQDAFSLKTLIQAVSEMRRERILPEVCDDNAHIEQSLLQQCQLDEQQFQQTMGAVANRLNKLVQHDHLYQIFTHVPEWDAEAEEYVGNVFEFRQFLDEDAVILFDLGELRTDSRNALTMLLLSNLWDAVQTREDATGEPEIGDVPESVVNVIIEEAAAVATSSFVYEQFLPQGRGFGVGLGLIMQYPEQVATHTASDRPYTEILNNIKTKIIGNIAVDEKLAESMAHENLDATELRNRVSRLPAGEWIVQLPSPRFGETGPAPFSMAPLPIPEGHPESKKPLSDDDCHLFEEGQMPRVRRRTQEQCSLPAHTDNLAREKAQDTLTEGRHDADTATERASGGTAAAESADGSSSSSTSIFGATDVSADTGASVGEDGATAMDGTATNDSPPEAQDIGNPPTFGTSTASETQTPEEAASPVSADPTTTAAQDERDDTADTESADVDEGTEDTEVATETPGDNALSEHVSYDGDANHYVCDVCGTEYTDAEERKASACCQFTSKEDVFVAARRARATTETSHELISRLGRIAEHAEDYGISVTIQDFASLDAAAAESPATTDDDGSEAPTETEQSQTYTGETSPRFREATTHIPDETLHAEGVTRDEAAFLGLVLDAMNHQLEEYSLRESMTILENEFDHLDVEMLIEKGFLEKHRSFRQKYYTVLPAGRRFLNRSLDASPGVGDLGEKTPHKAGVVFLEAWLAQQEDVDRTERYVKHDSDAVFDVAGYDGKDELCWVGEVETASNNADAMVADYEKLAAVDAKAAWAFESKNCSLDVIDALTEAGRVDFSLTATQKQTVSALRAAIGEYETPGMTALNTFRSLKTEVDSDP